MLSASAPDLRRVIPDDEELIAFLAAIYATMIRAARTKAFEGPVFDTAQAIVDYLLLDQGHAGAERVRVLFVSAANEVIKDVTLAHGSVDSASFSVAAVLRIALSCGAAGVLVVHNHPSGSPEPSAQDIRVTHDLVAAGRYFDVCVMDHLVVSRRGWTSFRTRGLL